MSWTNKYISTEINGKASSKKENSWSNIEIDWKKLSYLYT